WRERKSVVIQHQERAGADDDRALLGEVERTDRYRLGLDEAPDLELGPVRQRKNPHRLTRPAAQVVDRPQLRTLRFRIPAMTRGSERADALLGTRGFLVAPRAAEDDVEAVRVERLTQ